MSNLEDKSESKHSFLSADQLIQLGWHRDPSLPIRAVKQYAPNGSWMEDKSLQVTFRERAQLLAEERVAKLGSLARGEWMPDVKKVHLVKNKKKFWQTMGYSKDGMDFLQPEEALFLLDACMMEIYYGGVPLSLQQAYSNLLQCDLTMEQYQVFALLSRYGYILRRHNTDLILTEYERQLNLDQYLKAARKAKKRRCSSPQTEGIEEGSEHMDVPTKVSKDYSCGLKNSEAGVETADELAKCSEEEVVTGEHSKTPPASSTSDHVDTANMECRTLEQATTAGVPMETSELATTRELPANNMVERSTTSGLSLGSVRHTTSLRLSSESSPQTTSPELSLESAQNTIASKLSLECVQHIEASELCGETPERNSTCKLPVQTLYQTKLLNVPKGPEQDEPRPTSSVPYTKWDWTKVTLPDIANKSRLVLRKPSPDLLPCCVLYGQDTYTFDVGGFARGKQPEDVWEFSLGGTSWKQSIRASNWGDYRKEHRKYVAEYSLEMSPAGHLWRGDVKPLIKPQDAISTVSILKKLQIIESVQLSLPRTISDEGCVDRSVSFRIMFDVYLPNSRFKKTVAMFPHHHLCVVRSGERLPSLGETLALSRRCYPGVPLHFAVVDGGDINFYIFHDVKLPIDSGGK